MESERTGITPKENQRGAARGSLCYRFRVETTKYRPLLVSARFDRVVRWNRSQALWNAIGHPRRVVLPCGHYSAALFVPLIKLLSRRWFDRHLPGAP